MYCIMQLQQSMENSEILNTAASKIFYKAKSLKQHSLYENIYIFKKN